MKIHTYNNGLKFIRSSIFKAALKRYAKYINLHEPFEETVFDHIIKNCDIKTFVDLGSAWGYYSILAKTMNKDIDVTAFDPDKRMIDCAHGNAKLNNVSGIKFRNARIPGRKKLSDLIEELNGIDFIKIDIQGTGTAALESAGPDIVKIKNILLGTHNEEHDQCLSLLKKHGFNIKLNLKGHEIPIQHDGLLWATIQ